MQLGEGKRDSLAARARPKEGVRANRSRRHAPARQQAAGQAGSAADFGSVPHDASVDASPGADGTLAEDAPDGFETIRRERRQHPRVRIEEAASLWKRPTPLERFERRAKEIARAAEVGEEAFVRQTADLFPPLDEHRLPQVGDERGLAGRDAGQETRGQDTDPGVEKRPQTLSPEGLDSVPFGLKRRVAVRLSVFDDEQRRGSGARSVAGEQSPKIGLDCGISVDHEELLPRKPAGSVPEGSGRSQDLGLSEEAQIREIRRRIAELAFDLVAEMMQIDACFQDALSEEPPEVCPEERDV